MPSFAGKAVIAALAANGGRIGYVSEDTRVPEIVKILVIQQGLALAS